MLPNVQRKLQHSVIRRLVSQSHLFVFSLLDKNLVLLDEVIQTPIRSLSLIKIYDESPISPNQQQKVCDSPWSLSVGARLVSQVR